MKWLDKWVIKHINWIKPLEALTYRELCELQQDIGKAIEKKINEKQKG